MTKAARAEREDEGYRVHPARPRRALIRGPSRHALASRLQAPPGVQGREHREARHVVAETLRGRAAPPRRRATVRPGGVRARARLARARPRRSLAFLVPTPCRLRGTGAPVISKRPSVPSGPRRHGCVGRTRVRVRACATAAASARAHSPSASSCASCPPLSKSSGRVAIAFVTCARQVTGNPRARQGEERRGLHLHGEDPLGAPGGDERFTLAKRGVRRPRLPARRSPL